ncbi:uncharacterized protein ACA1_376470 [Acanthamoeba castellanii str. Neff]|uniref:Uncharacterized protein n=1 Tax=Acanthamoeba castellanii (strain ATCC 30010 / Neff) TaxID=1257118 RepID=L8HF94_ACACF|nr:uncharacterized protein ACA1_376470 [Acanthamoeba castellanii str. Neff]ELR24174.1 hypothetical protein ACA1_376470 [Acanthamoeba castellanii str. Neff]
MVCGVLRQAGSVVWRDSGTTGIYHSRGHTGSRQDSQGKQNAPRRVASRNRRALRRRQAAIRGRRRRSRRNREQPKALPVAPALRHPAAHLAPRVMVQRHAVQQGHDGARHVPQYHRLLSGHGASRATTTEGQELRAAV